VVVFDGGVDIVGHISESNSPDVVVFRSVLLGKTRIGLIEGDQDQIVGHVGDIAEFVVQKASQPARRGLQIGDETTFVSIGNVPGECGSLILVVILLEFSSINNFLAPKGISANVVHGHERIGEAEVFAFNVGLLIELSIVAWAGEVLGIHLPGKTNGIQLINNVGNVQVMDVVIVDVIGRSSDGSNVVGLSGMTNGSVIFQKGSSSGKSFHERIFDGIIIVDIVEPDDHHPPEEQSIRGRAELGRSAEGGCTTSCSET